MNFLTKLLALAAVGGSLMNGAMDTALPNLDADGTLILVNRENPISSTFIPPVREAKVSGSLREMQEEAAAALEEMFAACRKETRAKMVCISGYRPYDKQRRIYDRKLENVRGSVEKANEYVAPPGTSEHQTGLAMDVGQDGSSADLIESYKNTKSGKWLKENAHRFGFIIRYPQEWEDVTGYRYEPWHVRYVGADHAARIFEEQIPLETYIQNLRMTLLFDIIEQDD